MINFKNTTFVKSVTDPDDKPRSLSKEVVFLGRSNVGKSSLINALIGKDLAKTSSTPGKTILLNYFDVDHSFFLVDAPGYGYAARGIKLDKIFNDIMVSYFNNNKELKLALLLIDSRRGIMDIDKEMTNFLEYYKIPYFIVLTKSDKTNQKEKSACLRNLKDNGVNTNYIFTSISDKKSLDSLKGIIEKSI